MVKHPARYTDGALTAAASLLTKEHARILDPFAGTGRIHQLPTHVTWPIETVGVELEPEWAAMHANTRIGDALSLPTEWANTFDAVVTSPCYGNRLADHHQPKDNSVRRSYTFDLGRPLTPGNAGVLQWGNDYRLFHQRAWRETWRTLRVGGRLVLIISDHIRARQRQHVASWHTRTLLTMPFVLVDCTRITTPRLRYGANHQARTPSELILAFDKRPTMNDLNHITHTNVK